MSELSQEGVEIGPECGCGGLDGFEPPTSRIDLVAGRLQRPEVIEVAVFAAPAVDCRLQFPGNDVAAVSERDAKCAVLDDMHASLVSGRETELEVARCGTVQPADRKVEDRGRVLDCDPQVVGEWSCRFVSCVGRAALRDDVDIDGRAGDELLQCEVRAPDDDDLEPLLALGEQVAQQRECALKLTRR
ncbi:MAG: hypothetical protein KDC46_04250 [Thermoleophilia bacterium]|nr:hypothetical protein [Thermoleophilia bacterium]